MENIIKLLGNVKNPETGKTLAEEKRIKNVEKDHLDRVIVTYERAGISITQKRAIEEAVIEALRGEFSEDDILVKTVSETRAEKVQENHEEQAQLKVGHGQVGHKKRVPGVKKVIAVSSCKGGVGKSTVSVNLAFALKELGHSVGIMDADIYGPSLPILLGQRGVKPQATSNKKIKPLNAFGLSFISFGLFIDENDPVIWRGPMLGGVLNQFFFDTAWGELDYLIVDLPPGTGDVQLSLVQNTEVDGIIVVSTPQKVALADTKKGLKMFQQMKIPILGLVENMSYFAPDDSHKEYYLFGKGGTEELAKAEGLPFFGGIPLEIAMRESADEGRPYMINEQFKGKPGYKAYLAIARKISPEKKEKKGFLGSLFN